MKALSPEIRKALELACKAHQGQTDKGGQPYITHPLTVAMTLMANGYGEDFVVVGLLHDVAEDTEYGLDKIAALGFGSTVMEMLEVLTHDKAIPYEDYIERIANNSMAAIVKMEDLLHNMDLTRLEKVTEKDFERVKKYQRAYDYLKACVGEN